MQGRRTKSTRESGGYRQAGREKRREKQRARKRRGEATAIPDFHFN